MAYPNKAVEIAGPVRGNIRHAQYNTPCCMYSDAQIANTLISQAAAIGADVPGIYFEIFVYLFVYLFVYIFVLQFSKYRIRPTSIWN